MKQEEIKNIVEQIKSTLGIEELDALEREYNKLYKELKEQHEQSGSIQKND
jgi:ribonuclease HIII